MSNQERLVSYKLIYYVEGEKKSNKTTKKKPNPPTKVTGKEKRLVVVRGRRWGAGYEIGEGSQKVQNSSYKESACNEGDPGLIPGLGRSLDKGMATHSSILAWRIPWWATVHEVTKSQDTTEQLTLSLIMLFH